MNKPKIVWVAVIQAKTNGLQGVRNIAIVMNASSGEEATEIDYLITNKSEATGEWIATTFSLRNYLEKFYREAELQPLAGRNPGLARKVIKNEALGLKQDKPEHTQYVVIIPIIIAALMAFGIVRFIGMGTGNKGLYITGGVCLVTGMARKQLGSVKGARKRLGQ